VDMIILLGETITVSSNYILNNKAYFEHLG